MPMAGRHIRHDWQTFVDWEQKSVRTVCNKTSTFNAVGIPGVTDQPVEIEVGDKKYFGWCTRCSVVTYREASRVYGLSDIHPYILPMYSDVMQVTLPIYLEYVARQEYLRSVR